MALQDDESLIDWVFGARASESKFLVFIANAALSATQDEYCTIRPALMDLRAMYPQYNTHNQQFKNFVKGANSE